MCGRQGRGGAGRAHTIVPRNRRSRRHIGVLEDRDVKKPCASWTCRVRLAPPAPLQQKGREGSVAVRQRCEQNQDAVGTDLVKARIVSPGIEVTPSTEAEKRVFHRGGR